MKDLIFYIYFSLIMTISTYTCYGAKILGIFPFPAISRFTYNNAIMKSLIDAGHEVTIVTPFAAQARTENYTSIIDTSKDEFIYVGQTSYEEFSKLNSHEVSNIIYGLEKSHCQKVINLPQIREILTSKEKLYDILFLEILYLYECHYKIAEQFGIPIIGTVSKKSEIYADRIVSNSNHPIYVPFQGCTSWESKSAYGRIYSIWNTVVAHYMASYVKIPHLNQFHEENVELLGSDSKFLHLKPALIFYNNHASYFPKPMNPNAIEVGGIHVNEAKPLPKHLEKFINEAENGVVLFTLGSVIRTATLTLEIQNAFREAFAEIPQRVIWKFEEEMDNVPSNVMLMKWLPQRDILEHKNVRAFITQCGQAGIYETIYTATPAIAIPLRSDQPANAEIMADLGVAVRLDINDISKRKILAALNEIFNDTSYYNNMQKLSQAFRDRPMTPQQSVVYWTEYVIRHNGAPHLESAVTELNWYQYYLLDVICLITLFSMITLYFILFIVKITFRFVLKIVKRYRNNCTNKNKTL